MKVAMRKWGEMYEKKGGGQEVCMGRAAMGRSAA